MIRRAVIILLICCGMAAGKSCPAGWSQYKNRCFMFVSTERTWAESERYCISMGGNLASVHSREEYNFIDSLFSTHRVWIGGCDAVQEGHWLWSDGTKFDYTLWNPGEPNNSVLDCPANCSTPPEQIHTLQAILLPVLALASSMISRAVLILPICCGVASAWIECCPKDWFPYFERCFKFDSTPRTWIDAEQYCQSIGGNLASIHSSDEYVYIQGMIHKLTNTNPRTWIGGWDAAQEGLWLWSDGSKFDYTRWIPGEPNNRGGAENCIEMNTLEMMWWNDLPCNLARAALCSLS
ncbi:hypothetical protein ACEWY4_025959 [Coilia grayii]|uniref:C-type lectin domain-containing protein n=1 Tax=Coilia grayii TaxID=363190 RepID=A0ABD1ITR2_9TELE